MTSKSQYLGLWVRANTCHFENFVICSHPIDLTVYSRYCEYSLDDLEPTFSMYILHFYYPASKNRDCHQQRRIVCQWYWSFYHWNRLWIIAWRRFWKIWIGCYWPKSQYCFEHCPWQWHFWCPQNTGNNWFHDLSGRVLRSKVNFVKRSVNFTLSFNWIAKRCLENVIDIFW